MKSGGGVGGCCSLEAAVGEFIFIHITTLSMHAHFHVMWLYCVDHELSQP